MGCTLGAERASPSGWEILLCRLEVAVSFWRVVDNTMRMQEVLGQSLSDKDVMTSDGDEVGTIHNITMNAKDGELLEIIVTPTSDRTDRRKFGSRYDTDDRGRYRIPAGNVEAVKDYVLVG